MATSRLNFRLLTFEWTWLQDFEGHFLAGGGVHRRKHLGVLPASDFVDNFVVLGGAGEPTRTLVPGYRS